MSLFGQVLPPVPLRFQRNLRRAIDTSPYKGVRRYGPYDSGLFPQREIRCGVIYPEYLRSSRDGLVNGLERGDGSAFPGFQQFFKVRLLFDAAVEERVPNPGNDREFRRAATQIAGRNCDLVFILVPQKDVAIYRACKSVLLSNGIPCQFITADRLRPSNQRPWVLGNTALASYAKAGGTPWVVADTIGGRELVMGVSRAQDINKQYVVGFVTLFNQDGDFLFLNSKTPVVRWEDYVAGLEELVIEAYHDYQTDFGAPESLVIHFHKRPGQAEIKAVEKALGQLSIDIPFALLHLNEFSLFRVFDTAHSSYVPQAGLQVDLSRRRSLLLLDGRENGQRNRRGVPNIWDISLDKRSTMSMDQFPRLVQQIHRFARVNWRGFNARSTPVTINYSKLICDLVLEIGLSSWNSIVSNGRLRDKAWFL